MTVVDCQAHLHPRSYFEAHLRRSRPPYAERHADGYLFHAPGGACEAIPRQALDWDEQLEQLTGDGVDVVVSSMGAFAVDHLPVDQASELARQVNEERAELARRNPGRLLPLALLPTQDGQAAVETLDHAVETLGLRGVCIPSDLPGASLAARDRRAIYRRVSDLGVPLFLHPTGSGAAERIRRAAIDARLSAALDDSPTLQVVHPHLGGVAHPVTETVDGCREALGLAVAHDGAQRLLFASDYPYRSPARQLELVRARFDGDELEDICHHNAASLLGPLA